MMKKLFTGEKPMKIAAFMSGSGTNLRRILEAQTQATNLFKVVLIFSETANHGCKAKEIGSEYNIPVYVEDMRGFYKARGHDNKKDMKIREEFDKETAAILREHNVDIIALCGYESLVTGIICDTYLTINVHPGDLTKKSIEGRKKYIGLGWKPTKKAIVDGEKEVRSTTHLVTTELDGGPVIMVSASVPIDVDRAVLMNEEKFKEKCIEIQGKLKEKGDWKIYPATIKLVAEGRLDEEDGLIYFDGKKMENGIRYESIAEI